MTLHRDWALDTLRRRLTELEQPAAGGRSAEDQLRSAVHELEAYQEELRTQNENLLRAQEELEQSQQRYVDLFEYAPVGYLFLNKEGLIQQLNLRGAEMLGRARRDAQGQPLWMFLTRDYRDVLPRHLKAVFRRQRATDEVKVRRSDGSFFFGALESVLVVKEGEPAQFCRTAMLDVTERRAAEDALRESEERFRNLIEGSIQGIYIHQNWKPLFVNRAYARMVGYESPREILALDSLERCIAPHDRQRLNGYLAARLQGMPAPVHYEFDAQRRDGTVVTLEKVVRVIHWRGKLAVQDTVVDVTARKRAEEQVRQREAELSHVARLSTMGEMATMLAHELNQPLTAIVSYAEGAARRFGSDTHANDALLDVLDQTATLAKRAAEIVRGVRQFVRKQDISLQRVDLNDVIQEAQRFTAVETRKKGIAVTADLMTDLPCVEGNFTQLEQVVLNLIRNGIDAIDSSDIAHGSLRLSTFVNGEGEVQLSVQDTGPGLSDEIAQRLFEPFVTTKPDGLGIGLSVSRTIVEAHGGRIWADYEGESATTFHLTLPMASRAHDRRG